ncbi:MAG: Hsp33 family molecular chaperone HslO [Victivallaceae bacterium]|jgi:molecular chaperone Hsp33
MVHSDYLIRGILRNINARFVFAETTGTVARGIAIHDTDPVAAEIFAGALTVGALVSALLNKGEKYSLRWDYPGKISSIIVDSNADCDIRGIIKEPHLMDKISSEQEIYGEKDGFISIIKSEAGKILNSGKTRTAFGDAVADAGFFFSVSDQIETEFSTAIEFNPDPLDPVKRAGGFMIQAMPDCNLTEFEKYRKNICQPEFASRILERMPSEKKLWALAALAAGESEIDSDKNLLSYDYGSSPGFRCNCSFEKMKMAMSVLDRNELIALFKENANPAIMCNFCRKEYRFTRKDFPF